jgi:hypothetical protein
MWHHPYPNGIVHDVRLLMLVHLGHVKYVHVKKVLSPVWQIFFHVNLFISHMLKPAE